MEAKSDSFYLEYPSKMQVGDALKDGNLTMDIKHGMMQQTMSMLIHDRKVEGQESITTPAGTWNCYKISYKCKLGMKSGPSRSIFLSTSRVWSGMRPVSAL